MAGYGNYRGTSALALGVAHYRNESLMMHAGMSWAGGSSHMMANAGVTWKLGHRDPDQLGLRITTGNGGSERRKSGLEG